MAAHSRLGFSLALERIQHPQRRPKPRLLRIILTRRIKSRLHRSRRPRNRSRQPPPPCRSHHRRCANPTPSSEADPLKPSRRNHKPRREAALKSRREPPSPRRADGHITAEPGLLLAVQTADCIPVLVADRRQRIVAAFHAGWRGTVKRIVESGVGRMRLDYGSRPADLIAAIGPGASACCYSVGEEVLSRIRIAITFLRAPALPRGLHLRPRQNPLPHAVPDATRARPFDPRTRPARGSRRSQPPSASRLRTFTAIHSGGRRLHLQVPARIVLLASRLCKAHVARPHDGSVGIPRNRKRS